MNDQPVTSDPITVSAGDEFTVRLESAATTGYVWEVQSLPESIQLLGSDFESLKADARPGDSTTQVFRFRSLKPGDQTITFALKRRWEKDAISTRTVTVKTR